MLQQLHCYAVMQRRRREKPCRVNFSGDLRTLHLHRSSCRNFRRLDSLGKTAQITDAVLSPLNDRVLPRYMLCAPRLQRALVRSRDRWFSIFRLSPDAALSLGWSVVAGGDRFGHNRLLSPKHAALVRTDLRSGSIHLLVRSGDGGVVFHAQAPRRGHFECNAI
jgi:hypothetical protein